MELDVSPEAPSPGLEWKAPPGFDEKIREALSKPAVLPSAPYADERYDTHILSLREAQLETIRLHLESPGETLASATEGKYTVTIKANRRVLYESVERPGEPVGAGKWMDFPEEHWGISEAQYKALPEERRAAMEAQEQLRYAPSQFYHQWLFTYQPELYDALWWAKGGSSTWWRYGDGALNRYVASLDARRPER